MCICKRKEIPPPIFVGQLVEVVSGAMPRPPDQDDDLASNEITRMLILLAVGCLPAEAKLRVASWLPHEAEADAYQARTLMRLVEAKAKVEAARQQIAVMEADQ